MESPIAQIPAAQAAQGHVLQVRLHQAEDLLRNSWDLLLKNRCVGGLAIFYLSIYRSIYLSLALSLSLYLYLYLSIDLSIYLYLYIYIYIYLYLFIYIYLYLCVCVYWFMSSMYWSVD